jgi:hypothetical protein
MHDINPHITCRNAGTASWAVRPPYSESMLHILPAQLLLNILSVNATTT